MRVILKGLRLTLVIAAAILMVAGGWAFFRQSPDGATADRSYLTHKVDRRTLEVVVTADGMLESSDNIEIKCNVKGGSTVLYVIETGTMVQPGDVLVELDRSELEDKILEQKIAYEKAVANKAISESDVAVARTSIKEYLEGTYRKEYSTLEKEIFDAEQAVRAAELAYASATRLAAKGSIRATQLEGEQFALDSARKDLELKRSSLEALEKYTKEKMMQELNSTLAAATAMLAADEAALELEQQRLEREKAQLENCTIRSPGSGMVIFPSAAAWKETPDIEEGAVVREQQTLLMIPNLDEMQVKVGVHESKVDRLKVGMKATVRLQGYTLEGAVDEIAEVTRPAGWWTGNMVKYDTLIKLDQRSGLKPGMSAIVDIVLARYEDALCLPVAAIVEANSSLYCWVDSPSGPQIRQIEIGDTNDEYTIVTSGVDLGEAVVLDPGTHVAEARRLISGAAAAKQADEAAAEELSQSATGGDEQSI